MESSWKFIIIEDWKQKKYRKVVYRSKTGLNHERTGIETKN